METDRPLEPEIPYIPDHTLLHPIGRGSYGVVWLARTVGVSAACMHLSRAATYRVKALKISQAIALDAMRLVLNMMMLAK